MLPEMTTVGGGAVLNKKLTKARGKMVKPILKTAKNLKLSHSEKNSLDLDRGWDEQSIEQLENGEWDEKAFPGGLSGGAMGLGVESNVVSVPGGGSSIRAKFHHGRTPSQASTGSGPRGGAFIHPFAQAPRTSTPPLSYANSLASFDNTVANTINSTHNERNCSPTITENEDDFDDFDSPAQYHNHSHSHSSAPPPALSSQSNLSNPRRPSLQSQRTGSYTEVPSKAPSLRINTTGGTSRSASGATVISRLANGTISTTSQSDLQLTNSVSVSLGTTLDSPTGSLGAGTINNSSSGATQMSPLRSSLDMANFPRLRSRSELDTANRAEKIRAARRKFEERENIKEEKYDREMIKKRERRDTKEASRIEKGAPARPSIHRKNTGNSLSNVISPPASTSSGIQAVFGRKGASWTEGTTVSNSSRQDLEGVYTSSSAPQVGDAINRRHTDSPSGEEQMRFMSRKYDSVPLETPPAFGPNVDAVRFEQTRPRRGSGPKRKTQSYWAGFVLWLRTKLLRLGGR
ncbi:hypothetical protein QC764_101820 [Podospora pseudoanserina]|uniref:Uncharacterized protein n=1 Tax=Podospora pseudoanserina TaxID=2609844 RepID=A0ABR0IK33_9PEZI|nr:hypothetical protein QC764_101820 [Podospora pseudoanserina]